MSFAGNVNWKSFLLLMAVCIGSNGGYAAGAQPADLLKRVQLFVQSTIKFQATRTIYFDPFQVAGEPHDADIIFITHPHGDHLSVADIQKVMKPGTTIVLPEDGLAKAKAAGISKWVTVVPNQNYVVEGISFQTVPAYNTNKQFHPKENAWVGYIATINNAAYYIAGDTDLIPEMSGFKTDVAFLPVGGTYTMTAIEAAKAANIIKPAIAVPIHYGAVVGTAADAQKFLSLLDSGIKGIILQE
jgi:L-ascorbate metabolism protein UlaG (beta-lactamase superfamily)